MGLLARLGFVSREQSTPSNPAAGFRALYAKTGGWYEKDSAGVERLLSPAIEAYPVGVTGTLTVQPGTSLIYLEGSYVIETVRAAVNTAPTGAAVIVDVLKNGVTLYTAGVGRPTIAAGTKTATGNTPAVTTFVAGDYFTVDVVQVGSTIAGADLTVTVRLRRTA